MGSRRSASGVAYCWRYKVAWPLEMPIIRKPPRFQADASDHHVPIPSRTPVMLSYRKNSDLPSLDRWVNRRTFSVCSKTWPWSRESHDQGSSLRRCISHQIRTKWLGGRMFPWKSSVLSWVTPFWRTIISSCSSVWLLPSVWKDTPSLATLPASGRRKRYDARPSEVWFV